MNRNNKILKHFPLLLVLVLVSTMLFGCVQNPSQNDQILGGNTQKENFQEENQDSTQQKSVFDDDETIEESSETDTESENENNQEQESLSEDEYYYSVEDVSLFLHTYNRLPDNYITKSEAHDMGWEADDDSGLVIGGDRFGNREGLLPNESGRQYYEADISDGYTHHRGPKRLVYSNDGLIFYTEDHYESFEQLY